MRHIQSAGILVLALVSATISAQSLWRRASSNVTIPAAISIAPSQYWEGNDGTWSTFPLQVGGGSTTQDVRVMVSTAGYNVFTIAATGCPTGYVADCADLRGGLFLTNESLTWVPESIFDVGLEANLDLDTTANAGYDTVILGWQGSGGPEVTHTVIFNVGSPNFWFGIFGLNPEPTNFTNLNDPQKSYMQSLYDNSVIPSRSYGYTAGNTYRLDKVFGSLTLGGYDENRFSGGISWPFYTDISRDLLVDIKSITSSAGNTTDLLPDGQISALIDSTVAQMWLPLSACEAFEQAFGLTYNTTKDLYLVDSATHERLLSINATVNLTLTNGDEDVTISFPYQAFDLNVSQPYVDDTNYYFPLQRAANNTQYTLGRTFLQEAYLIADYDRSNFTVAPCDWNETKLASSTIKSILSPNLTVIAAEQSSAAAAAATGHGISTAAIAGIVVGVVILGSAAIALTFFVLRRRAKKRQQAALDEKVDIDGDSKNMFVGVNELGDDQIGELDAPYRGKVQELDSPYKIQELDSPYKVNPDRHGYRELDAGKQYGSGDQWPHEMDGATPIYEMPGSEVQEMSARMSRQADKHVGK